MPAEQFISYAQNLEDVLLWRALRDAVPGPGRYIDIGAADPTALSVTRAFYDRGWRGLNVEPLPEMAERLRQARPEDIVVQAAVGAETGTGAETRPFHRVLVQAQTGLSTLEEREAARHAAAGAAIETFDVPVVTLAALCREHAPEPVHFLKIDVEGAEAEVLDSADFTRTRPWIVLVEATMPASNIANESGWEPGLLANGYRFAWFDGLNRFYLADEHADLARHFEVQPNVFDNYVQWDGALRDTLAATEDLATARLRLIEDLQGEVRRLSDQLAANTRDQPPPATPTP